MRSVILQSSFVSGEIDPILYDRLDIQQRERAARSLTNFRILPQGGIQKRDGTKYLASAGSGKLLGWVYSTSEAYVVMMLPGELRIFSTTTGTVVATIVNTLWTTASLVSGTRYRQVLDTMFITQREFRPQRLIRLGGFGSTPFAVTSASPTVTVTRLNHNLAVGDRVVFNMTATFAGFPLGMWANTFVVATVPTNNTFTFAATQNSNTDNAATGTAPNPCWALSALAMTNIPRADFSDTSSPAVAVNTVYRLTFMEDWIGAVLDDKAKPGHSLQITYNGVTSKASVPWIETTGTTLPDVAAMKIRLQSTLDSLPTLYDKSTAISYAVVQTPVQNSLAGDTDVGIDSSGQLYFLIEFKGPYVGRNPGILYPKITGPTPLPSAVFETETDGADRTEPVWSNSRGWPKAVEFFEGRLCLGGSTYAPASFWASVVSDYFNFQVGDALDDEAISRDVDINAADSVEHLIGARSLMVMSRRGEYYQTETPMIPETCTFKQQTSHGSSNIAPCKVGGSVYFVQRNGGAIRRLLYNFQEDAYVADEVSILARHLFDSASPVGLATYAHEKDGDYIFVPLSTGNIAVLAIDKSQEVAGWSTYYSDYRDALDMVAVNDEVYVLGKYPATISPFNAETYSLEKFATGRLLDNSTVQTGSSNVVSGLSYLLRGTASTKATGVCVRVDFADLQQAYVDSNPFISTAGVYTYTASGSYVGRTIAQIEIGYGFTATLRTLPADPDSASGKMLMRRKRITRATLDCSNTDNVGLSVGGYAVKQQSVFGENATSSLDPAVWRIDGQVSTPLLGWGRGQGEQDLVIQHVGPGACLIKAIEREVEVTGHLGEDRDRGYNVWS